MKRFLRTKLKRVYHPYEQWEEIRFNMWGDVSDRDKSLSDAIAFTGNHSAYGHYMRRVVVEWPISCENALTDYAINRRAWVGHAAVALAIQIPEDIVREAWSELSSEQQFLANIEATRAIAIWEKSYRKTLDIQGHLDEAMLL